MLASRNFISNRMLLDRQNFRFSNDCVDWYIARLGVHIRKQKLRPSLGIASHASHQRNNLRTFYLSFALVETFQKERGH
jgi:hypothetical protein